MEACRHEDRGQEASNQQPGSAAHKEIRDRTPEKVETRRQRQQSDKVGLPSAANPLLAEQVGEHPTLDHAIHQDSRRCNQHGKEPRPILLNCPVLRQRKRYRLRAHRFDLVHPQNLPRRDCHSRAVSQPKSRLIPLIRWTFSSTPPAPHCPPPAKCILNPSAHLYILTVSI